MKRVAKKQKTTAKVTRLMGGGDKGQEGKP